MHKLPQPKMSFLLAVLMASIFLQGNHKADFNNDLGICYMVRFCLRGNLIIIYQKERKNTESQNTFNSSLGGKLASFLVFYRFIVKIGEALSPF